MQSELKSLSKIFTEAIFRIPDYQRGYSWQEKQLKEFWSDIEQLTEGQSHYTGVLTLEPANKTDYARWDDDQWIIESKRYAPMFVVDGQQRLTTAVVLLQCIIEHLSDTDQINYTSAAEIRKKYIFESRDGGVSRSYIFGYVRDNPSYNFLKQEIFREASSEHHSSEQTIYTANLKSAKKFFCEKLSDKNTKQLESIYSKLTQHFLFNIFFIEPELDVFVTFETMNNRGKPLSHLELLKNRLIYLSTKFSVDSSERDALRRTINESWKTVYHNLGKSNNRRLSDDIFLRTHFLTYFGPHLPRLENDEDESQADINIARFVREDHFKDYLLDEIFNPKRLSSDENNPLTLTDIYDYAMNIKSVVATYYQTINPSDSQFPGAIRVYLEQLNRLGFYPARLMAVILQETETPEAVQIKVLTALERFVFLMQFKPYRFADVKVDQLAIKLKSEEFTPDEIIRKLESASDTFIQSSEFPDTLQRIGKDLGYYRWDPVRYFMFEYEQHLREKSKSQRHKLEWDEFSKEDYDSDHKSVEHIFPQSAGATYWRTHFSKYSVRERNTLRNSIGNLLPLSKPKNSSLSNKPFPEKKGSAANQAGYMYGCLSEVQVSQETDWTAISIVERGIRILTFMESRWRVKIGSTEDKVKALGLGFVLNREGISLDALKI